MDEHQILSEIISRIAEPFALLNDAFVLDNFVITKDLLAEGVHFFPFAEPYTLAKKALRVNLSDLAAMGAEPIGYFLGLVLGEKHKNSTWLNRFAEGLLDDQQYYRVKLFGGDIVTHSGPLLISVTMIGKKGERVLTRSGAESGDELCVSGPIGDSYLGLLSYRGELQESSYLRNKYDLPEPRLDVSRDIISSVTSCIDISDGLLSEAQHLARNSSVSITIFLDKLPISDEARVVLSKKPEIRRKLITAGDDYQLLFTVPQKHPVTRKYPVIGFVSEGLGEVKVLDLSGREISFGSPGFVHR
ncbi:thiamine-phosphate kinase [Neorickettsia sp. 179522]|uniref:thiamine-phosphate kinase n=1 Tax=Neorickettsia sp. 179522 TaxID=1714371 RepID=UPI000835555F|nr:thiamine-phosphate kinase [Neorickettsia sp. 179522]